MKISLTIILIGIVAGFLGIIPALRNRTDKYFIVAVFLFYFMMPYLIYNLKFPFVAWWLKGAVVSFLFSLSLIISAGRGYKRVIFPMIWMSFIIGGFITFIGHYLL